MLGNLEFLSFNCFLGVYVFMKRTWSLCVWLHSESQLEKKVQEKSNFNKFTKEKGSSLHHCVCEEIRLSFGDGDIYICLLDDMWHKLLSMFPPQHIWFHHWAPHMALDSTCLRFDKTPLLSFGLMFRTWDIINLSQRNILTCLHQLSHCFCLIKPPVGVAYINQQNANESFSNFRMEAQREKRHTCWTICLKYLLLLFNVLFWVS